MTVGELGRRMSSAEFVGWMEYARLEPVGPAALFTPAPPQPAPLTPAELGAKIRAGLRAAAPRKARKG